jgi:2-oxoglutarate dehydrogenase E2 component (dihydrolipoamide succinyltransferase)
MSSEVRVPALPESVADATVATWHKRPGDPVKREENLVDLETDKVVLEVPSPIDGILGEILANEGDLVQSDAVLALIEASDAGATPPTREASPPARTAPPAGRQNPRRRPRPAARSLKSPPPPAAW